MKYTTLFLLLILSIPAFAQQIDPTTTTIDLNEVVIKNSPLFTKTKKVRSENVVIVINPKFEKDKLYYATKFDHIADETILLNSVELRLRPYDTSAFDIYFIVLQKSDVNTTFVPVKVNGGNIYKDKITVDLSQFDIRLKPSVFYLGFGFEPKNLPKSQSYRMFASRKGGLGAIIRHKQNSFLISENENFPFVFPFKLSFKK